MADAHHVWLWLFRDLHEHLDVLQLLFPDAGVFWGNQYPDGLYWHDYRPCYDRLLAAGRHGCR